MKGLLLACACALVPTIAGAAGTTAPAPPVDLPADAGGLLSAAERPAAPWSGPRTGPRAQAGRHVVVVDEDLRNGGILGVVDGVLEAAKVIGWTVKVLDAAGTAEGRQKMLAAALASRPDGVILVGSDARGLQPGLQPFAARAIPMVGWHVATRAGPVAGTPVAMNVTTDALEVARITALAAVAQSGGHAGVVLFTDDGFELPRAKAAAMAAVIRACGGCTLLETHNVAISRSREEVPALTRELLARHGKRWTHALAINDLYFDYAAPVFTQAGLPNSAMSMLSAGDGSESAFLRIRSGTFQTGTVAEPLTLHGWQLVDEMNRLFAGEAVSGYVFPVHLVTAANIGADGGDRLVYDPANGYRDIYRRIWQRP